MLDEHPGLHITVTVPLDEQCITTPQVLNADILKKHGPRLRFVNHRVIPNALATRYDFDFELMGGLLKLCSTDKDGAPTPFDVVYVNDPMLLRNYQALFLLHMKYRPKFVVHSHFIDDPSAPKFPTDASLWMGQCEAARKADVNFWQCGSSMEIFFKEMSRDYQQRVVDAVKAKSWPWDDGYSSGEIQSPINESELRFDRVKLERQLQDKLLIFVPNRVGGKGRSSDYTNCGHFMFEVLPKLRSLRKDFVVIAGNPSQKITNQELTEWCGDSGYLSVVPDALNRSEFKWIARRADIAVGLYNQDSYGGTAARECIELGCLPMWLNCYEYSRIARLGGFEEFLANPDMSNVADKLGAMMDFLRIAPKATVTGRQAKLQDVVKMTCSYEETTLRAMKKMGLDPAAA
jgi:hypothetical protein